VRAGLAAGMELERPALRRLRTELRRAASLAVAGRALARRDLSSRALASRLDRAGASREVVDATMAALVEAGVVDDARVANAWTTRLCERGWGDVAILARLERAGIDGEVAEAAVRALPPEHERARTLIDGEPDVRRAARTLARRGFAQETLEDLFPALDADDQAGVR
jgi:SOS response regulatory protein OraA/RecX